MTKQQWKHLYRQIRLGQKDSMITHEIRLEDKYILECYGRSPKELRFVKENV